jgi:transposase
MMGPRQVDQASLFYEFSLERHVPATHLLRSIDRFVDLSDVRSHLAPFYSSAGRPSIDPELLVRMLLVGYCYGIRSERRLCEEVHLNLAYRWFCRLGLDGEVPDHSTFSKNRHGRFRDCDLLRKLFETVVRRCMAEGLVDGAAFAVDASLIAADANKQRSVAGSDDVDWEAIARTRRSVREYLDTLDEAAWGAASETVPKFISRSDPAAQWTGAHKGHEWHKLGLRADSERFTVSYDGKTLFSVTDKTFGEAGGVALWTKADSVTRFDQMKMTTLPQARD